MRADRLGAALGAVGIAGNVLGVVLLGDVPGAYRPGAIDAWIEGSLAHRADTVASAAAFTLGLLALAGWARALGARTRRPLARAGAAAIAAGAVVNAAGTLTPAVLVLHVAPGCAGEACLPVARALLGLTLSLDALFNAVLGVGLVLVAAAVGPALLRALGVIAGVATIPVSLQIAVDAAAAWLPVAALLWLAYVAATSALLARGRADRPPAPAGAGGRA